MTFRMALLIAFFQILEAIVIELVSILAKELVRLIFKGKNGKHKKNR